MSVEASAEVSSVGMTTVASAWGPHPLKMIAKNLFVLTLVGGVVLAYETGYFSNDRISRRDWVAINDFPKERAGKAVYEAVFAPDLLERRNDPRGNWNLYNGARPETVGFDGGALFMKYSLAWLGVYFDHTAFEPKSHYRVRFEAKVEGEPAAILMRNRQLDYMRQQLPTTGNEFKEFTAAYAAPAGRLDQTKVIFMPDGRGQVSGTLHIRKFRIERLEK